MFKFFHGTGNLPDYFEEVFLCQSLNISLTELEKQPDLWVEKSIEYLTQKSNYDEAQAKREQQKAKAKR